MRVLWRGGDERELTAAVDARWEELLAASERGGVPATHCGGLACFGPHGSLCECECAVCEVALALHEQAELEVTPATRLELGEVLAEMERNLHVPEDIVDRIVARVIAARSAASSARDED